MANRRNLNHADIAKLMEASDSSEEVSEYKNHTSDEIESESSDNDFDTAIQQMNYKGNIQPKNHESWICCHFLLNQPLFSGCFDMQEN
ncbi:hypothetical protein HNY73_020271 [Argiope bruennichi]|uniref:Uncharacterized protein n=1 Tax=Argiope bruennichi TaxID=94029 RepID=A0A8T0E7D7_ARGBR|nr:hypothetical protein HNY73_020271 [Argiope bruennichi]